MKGKEMTAEERKDPAERLGEEAHALLQEMVRELLARKPGSAK